MSLRDANRALDLLDQHPWEDTIPKLVTHALKKSRRLYWRAIYGGHLPEGKEAVDLVHQAIEKLLTGQREWNPDANPDLFLYLRGIVDSDLNHLAKSWENRFTQSEMMQVSGTDCDGEEKEFSVINMVPSAVPNPEEVLLHQGEESRADGFFWGFYESLADKPRLQKIIECILDDVEKPADIAEKLGEPVNEIYNARKQLQRRLDEYRNKKSS